jgi:hypothetical protein
MLYSHYSYRNVSYYLITYLNTKPISLYSMGFCTHETHKNPYPYPQKPIPIPMKTHTHTHENPYPCLWVWVFVGMDMGFYEIPRGYP